MDVIHTAIWVSDVEEAKAYFVDALDLEVQSTLTIDGVENVFVGGEHGEIQLRYAPDHGAPAPDRAALDHIAISVADVDAATDRLVEETGSTVHDGPMTIEAADARVSFVEGPDGYVLELVEALD